MVVDIQQESSGNEHAAIAHISGAQSGDLVLTFSGVLTFPAITVMSLTNVRSLTPLDTDSATTADGTASLASLASPGAGGIRIAVLTNDLDTTAITWTNGTEIADFDAGDHRHSVAYDLGNDAVAISVAGGADDDALVGVSIR